MDASRPSSVDGWTEVVLSTVRFFTNAVDSRTRGVDVVLDYTFPAMGDSTLNLSVAASDAKTVVKDVKDNPAGAHQSRGHADQ